MKSGNGVSALIIVVMGVSGADKSTLGRALAEHLKWDFIEGDEHHPNENVEKMRMGRPLNDDDRRPWLERLRGIIVSYSDQGRGAVLTCSALKAEYREILRRGVSDLRFVFLTGTPEMIRERMAARKPHFMPPELLDSQFAELEPPENAVHTPVDVPTEEQVRLVCQALAI